MVWIADKISTCSLMILVQGNNPFPMWNSYNGAISVDLILAMKNFSST